MSIISLYIEVLFLFLANFMLSEKTTNFEWFTWMLAWNKLHLIGHFQSFGSYELMCFFQENAWRFRRTTLKHIPLISNFLTHVAMESSYAVRRWTLEISATDFPLREGRFDRVWHGVTHPLLPLCIASVFSLQSKPRRKGSSFFNVLSV